MNAMHASPSPVGAIVRQWSDPTRPAWNGAPARPLQTMIWYPTDDRAHVRAQRIAIFRTGRYAIDVDAPRVADGPHPLVVVSHGTGGSAASIAWLCRRLAEAGFVVAAVNHHGGTAAEHGGLTLPGAALWWERPTDLSRVLDRVLADPAFGARIDSTRISVAGFSIGAYTALAVAGARLQIDRWRPYCGAHGADSSLCRVPPEAGFRIDEVWDFLDSDPLAIESLTRADVDYRDERVKAVAAIAPVTVPLLEETSLATVTAPVHVFAASDDDQSTLDADVRPLVRSLPSGELTIIDGAGHYTFLSERTLAGRLIARRFVADRPGISRRRIHDRVAAEAISLFDVQRG